MPRHAIILGAVAMVLPAAGVTTAAGALVTERDAQGREIHFDVRAEGADVAGYRDILDRSVHGDEITGVVIRVVPPARVRAACRDARSVGCYSRGPAGAVITIPARPARGVQVTLLHEYGHHVDATVRTPRWWRARKMGWRLSRGQVARDYARGWSRSVGEVFAEDYVALHVRAVSAIRWLAPPTRSVRAALRRDITSSRAGGSPARAPVPAADPAMPAGADALARALASGAVGAGKVVEASVAVDAPGRHVTVAVRPDGSRAQVAVRIELTCDGMAPVAYAPAVGEVAYVRAGPLGPGRCVVRVGGPPDAEGVVGVEMVVTASPAGAPRS